MLSRMYTRYWDQFFLCQKILEKWKHLQIFVFRSSCLYHFIFLSFFFPKLVSDFGGFLLVFTKKYGAYIMKKNLLKLIYFTFYFQMTPALFGRIRQALEVLLDFFNADDKGLLMKEMNTELYMVSDECSPVVEYCVLFSWMSCYILCCYVWARSNKILLRLGLRRYAQVFWKIDAGRPSSNFWHTAVGKAWVHWYY